MTSYTHRFDRNHTGVYIHGYYQVVVTKMTKETTNYAQFKKIKGNRGISKSHVRKLMRSVIEDNRLQYNPIEVNKDMGVVDGQHRLRVAEILKVPVYYIVNPNADIDTVVSENTSSHNWVGKDFLFSWIERGNDQYVQLARFCEDYKMPLGAGRRLLSWDKSKSGDVDGFKNGKFKVGDVVKAVLVTDILKAIALRNPSRLIYTHIFLLALMDVVEAEKYNHSWFLKKLATSAKKFWSSEKKIDYLRQLEDIYNENVKREKNKIRFS